MYKNMSEEFQVTAAPEVEGVVETLAPVEEVVSEPAQNESGEEVSAPTEAAV